MKVIIYANYGTLAHEKQTAYSTAPLETAVFSDPLTIEIPESVNPCRNDAGSVVVTLDGSRYMLSEVLTNAGDTPVISWFDGCGYKTISLTKDETEATPKTFYILRDLDGYGSASPVCVGREEAEDLMRGWYAMTDTPDFDEVWREANKGDIDEYGISH